MIGMSPFPPFLPLKAHLCLLWLEIQEGVGWKKSADKRNRMPPVDAIYRPHVVHHTIVPPDLKAQQVKNKTKRYFSADD